MDDSVAVRRRRGRDRRCAPARGPGWRHMLHLWCGIDDDRAAATRLLAGEMEALYGLPFERFARYCPVGRPEDVAEAVEPYVAAGCRDINLITVARDPEAALDGTVAVRDFLDSRSRTTRGSAGDHAAAGQMSGRPRGPIRSIRTSGQQPAGQKRGVLT